MKKALVFLAATHILFSAYPQDPAQWRGPRRDGHYPSEGLLKEWTTAGPPLLWTCKGIGKGYSSAVSDGKSVYVTGMKDTTDYLTAMDMNGKLLWQVPFGPSWNGSFPETRCTPTVTEGNIYLLSGRGTISSIRAVDGKKNWSFDAAQKFSGVYGEWGVCESLLVTDGLVICTPAGPKTSMVALDMNTGKTVWESPSLHDTGAYVSPLLIARGGKKIIVTLMATNLIGVDAANGSLLWKYDYASLDPEQSLKVWPGAPKTNTITPLYHDGRLFITGGYDHPGAMFTLSEAGDSIALAWTCPALDCHHGGVVLQDGYIYGSNWLDNSRGNWCCIDWNTGKTMYEEKWQTKGSIIEADGMLYVFDEKSGNVGLLNPDPAKFDLRGSFRISAGTGPCWSHPAIRGGILYIRRGDVVMAFDVRHK